MAKTRLLANMMGPTAKNKGKKREKQLKLAPTGLWPFAPRIAQGATLGLTMLGNYHNIFKNLVKRAIESQKLYNYIDFI